MRSAISHQLPLALPPVEHVLTEELAAFDERLRRLPPEVYDAVILDVTAGGRADTGRCGMSGDQVLRVTLLRQRMQWTFAELHFHLLDSRTCRLFCLLGLGCKPPSVGTLKRNCKKLSEHALRLANRALLRIAQEEGIENGEVIRGDSTVMETNIHHPTDSELLTDATRMLTAKLERARQLSHEVKFSDRTCQTKRRAFAINNARGMDAKLPLYCQLYRAALQTTEEAELAAVVLEELPRRSEIGRKRLMLAGDIHFLASLARRVLDQTKRRVFEGESVPSSEKVTSLSEPHTDIIVKGSRDTQYGHKLFLSTGQSGLITDCYVGDGNPSDSGEAVPTVQRVGAIFGRVAREVSFDGGYASRENLETLKESGVEEVAFHKRPGLEVEEMTSSPSVYQRLRKFRAGIEGTISWLKRTFGLRRCLMSGRASFNAHAQAAVLAANLVLLSRLSP